MATKQRSRSPKTGTAAASDLDPADPSITIKNLIAEEMGKAQDQMVSVCSQACTRINTAAQTVIDERLGKLDDEVQSVKCEVQSVKVELKAQSAQILAQGNTLANIEEGLQKLLGKSTSLPELSQALASSEAPMLQPPQGTVGQTSFFRPTNPTILFANTEGKTDVTLLAFKTAVTKLAGEANIGPEDFEVLGGTLDSSFEIRFRGPFDTARARATQFSLSLKLGAGKYKSQSVLSPNQVETKFFLNPDKNGCQIRKEVYTKALKAYLHELLPHEEFFMRRSDGIVFHGRRPVVQVVVVAEEASGTRLSWKHSKRIALGLDQAAIETKFKEIVSNGGGEAWS